MSNKNFRILLVLFLYSLFRAVIAALFSLIPYVGNILGLFLAIAMSFLSGGGGGAGQ